MNSHQRTQCGSSFVCKKRWESMLGNGGKLCCSTLGLIIAMKIAEIICQSPGSHLNTLFFSPPPEHKHTSIDSHLDQSGSEIFLNLDPVEELPTTAGFTCPDVQEEVHPLVSVTPLIALVFRPWLILAGHHFTSRSGIHSCCSPTSSPSIGEFDRIRI